MVYKFLDKKSAGGAVKSKNTLNQQLAEKLYKTSMFSFYRQHLGYKFI